MQSGKWPKYFFWLDRWLLPEPLATAFPAIFSHHIRPHILVSTVLLGGIDSDLRNRLTSAAASELLSLRVLLQDVQLSGTADHRTMLDGSRFSTKSAYAALSTQLQCPHLANVWESFVPQKVKIFGWLLSLDRLNTRENLHKKTIVGSVTCPRCGHTVESRDHLFFICPHAQDVWNKINVQPAFQAFSDLWTTPVPAGLHSSVWPSIALVILWKIWDARNSMVFRSVDQSSYVTISKTVDDITL
jgi:hypothetical protein